MRSIIAVLLSGIALSCNNGGLGSDCGGNVDCESGHCPSDDLVCCDRQCDDPCYSCRLPGREGTCWPLPDGESDSEIGRFLAGRCGMLSTCLAQACVSQGSGFLGGEEPHGNGFECARGEECASAACAFGQCRMRNQSPCEEADECASNNCSDDTCVPCFVGNYCPTGSTCNMDPMAKNFGHCAD